jgi:hypothetical protein
MIGVDRTLKDPITGEFKEDYRLSPLGSDKDGASSDENWSYPAAVGMLLYLSSRARPDIQFAVHQVAHFSHNP